MTNKSGGYYWILHTLFAVLLRQVVLAAVDHKMVYLVDYYKYNILYRTGDPTNQTMLDYTQLVESFKVRAKEDNVTFPTQFYLVQYSLLNWEKGDEPIEMKKSIQFYKTNPHLGKFLHYKVVGDNLDSQEPLYAQYNDAIIEQYPKASKDLLHLIAGQLRKELVTQANIAKIIFFHCERGRSRAGIVFGAYNMMYHRWTYPESYLATGLPLPKNRYIQALNWFCWYWQHQQNNTFNYQCDQFYIEKADGSAINLQQSSNGIPEVLETTEKEGFASLVCSVTGLFCSGKDPSPLKPEVSEEQELQQQMAPPSSEEDSAPVQQPTDKKIQKTKKEILIQGEDKKLQMQQKQKAKKTKKTKKKQNPEL